MANYSASFGDAIFGDISFAASDSSLQPPIRAWAEICPVISEWNDAPALDSGFVNQQIASSNWAKQDIDSLSFKRCRR
jgi:hypothetical protein